MHALTWFEILALDLNSAFRFNAPALRNKVRKGTFGNGELMLFDVPFNTGEAVGGSIVVRADLKPTTYGPVIHRNVFGILAYAVARIRVAGGTVPVPFLNQGKFGFLASSLDSEGNRVGLISGEK